jgi:radical SAM protein with 4Fe4S-binding SPASM domain
MTPEVVLTTICSGRRGRSADELAQKHCDTLINEDLTHFGCDHLFHCGAGRDSFSVSYDGRFRLCSSLWAAGTTYDLRSGPLVDAWLNFVPRILDLRSQRKEFLESCRKCALLNLCLWCPAHAHLETGALDGTTPYFCAVAHARAQTLRPD